MLNKDTKDKIDDLRQILVGKVTDPRSQVEQITNALLYKFMNDMDEDSVSMGGVPSYFVKDFERYSWKNIFSKKTSGEERVKIYSEGIEKMYFNENLPDTFREIFKNSTLPFKETKVFNKFINRINDFRYSNSESLGDAFEYLLSFMGKQGDAGQFRTPRHIIDFVVELINPNKKERILDPASGTAGFLISAFKHILKNNKNKIPGDMLNSEDRKNIGNNLNGYDISPEFLKVSLMNMFLHKFNNPNIFEYDTLSDENKWNEYFDVILANPPFFSPKGGITPHNRFRIKSKRAEVLFTDYIDEHLKPNGRAGIIVPEGIIFRNDKGYKALRLRLLKNSLVGIISLPTGVFQPYSNVKTSILILDKKIKKSRDFIYFAKINNDGFSLSTNRAEIDDNDIPEIKDKINSLDFSEENKLKKILLKDIKDYNLREHIVLKTDEKSIYEFKKLKDISEINAGNSAPQKKELYLNGKFPFIRTSDVGEIKQGEIFETRDYLNNEGINKLKKYKKGSILFPKSGASTLLNHRVIMGIDAYVSSHLAVIKANNEKILDSYLFYLLETVDAKELVPNPSYPSLKLDDIKNIEIPVPDIETQKKIVDEIEGYKKIIKGCKLVIENFTPDINIDSKWKTKKLKEICDLGPGGTPLRSRKEYWNGDIPWYTSGELDELFTSQSNEYISELGLKKSNCKLFPKGSLLIGMYDTAAFKMSILDKEAAFNQAICGIKPNKQINLIFLYLFFIKNKKRYLNDRMGVRQRNLSKDYISTIEVPIPEIGIQNKIVDKLKKEIDTINSFKDLIKVQKQKITKKLKNIWLN